MKFAANFLLTILFIILAIALLLLGVFKFQLLDFHFWQNAFSKDNVYQELAVASKNSLDSQIASEGGSKSDARILTDLITPGNVRDFVDRNVQNILAFANGNSPQ